MKKLIYTLFALFAFASCSKFETPQLPYKIVYCSKDGGDTHLYSINSDGQQEAQLTNFVPNSQSSYANIINGSWSPIEKRICFISNKDEWGGEIYSMNADGSGLTRLTYDTRRKLTSTFSVDGRKILFYVDAMVGFGLYSMNSNGTSEKRMDMFFLNPSVSWSPDGSKIVYVPYGSKELFIFDINTGHSILLTRDQNLKGRPAFSPNGQRIAFSGRVATSPSEQDQIFTIDVDGSNLKQLTNFPAKSTGVHADFPSWSLDGTRIAFSCDEDGQNHIYVMNFDGSGLHKLTSNTRSNTNPVWVEN